jgi:hydrogenase/urease accessory protein HupE
MSLIKELWSFLRTRRKAWLWPVFVAMAVLGALIVLAQGSAVAPFIYTLF